MPPENFWARGNMPVTLLTWICWLKWRSNWATCVKFYLLDANVTTGYTYLYAIRSKAIALEERGNTYIYAHLVAIMLYKKWLPHKMRFAEFFLWTWLFICSWMILLRAKSCQLFLEHCLTYIYVTGENVDSSKCSSELVMQIYTGILDALEKETGASCALRLLHRIPLLYLVYFDLSISSLVLNLLTPTL